MRWSGKARWEGEGEQRPEGGENKLSREEPGSRQSGSSVFSCAATNTSLAASRFSEDEIRKQMADIHWAQDTCELLCSPLYPTGLSPVIREFGLSRAENASFPNTSKASSPLPGALMGGI